MKKIIRTAAMVALMFATATGMANEPKLSLSPNADTKSFVYDSDASSVETTIKLLDAENRVLYFESIAPGAFTKKFDLENLENGLYFFTTEDVLKKVTYVIEVKRADVKIIERKENTKPVFIKKDGKVYLNLLNLDKKEVAIAIYDSGDRLVFSEKRENETVIEKAFDFTKAYGDNYTVVVTKDDTKYFKDVEVK